MSQNLDGLSRSSSASKAMRNMGIHPGVQAKLMAFQAKRQQQMQQSKNHTNNSIDNLAGPDASYSSFNNKPLDTSVSLAPYDDEEDLMNCSPIDSKVLPTNINNSPSTPLSLDSSTFSSPIISPNDERKLVDDGCLSRRTSFRLSNNNHSHSHVASQGHSHNLSQGQSQVQVQSQSQSQSQVQVQAQAQAQAQVQALAQAQAQAQSQSQMHLSNNSTDDVMRRTSFRLNKSSSITSSSTLSDDSEELLSSGTDSDLKRKTSEKSKVNISPIYPVNKNLSFLSKLQKIQSNSSSSESLSNKTASSSSPATAAAPGSAPGTANSSSIDSPSISYPPSKPLPSLPGSNEQAHQSHAASYRSPVNSDRPIIAEDQKFPSQTATPTQPISSKSKLSLSQRRGMKLNLNALNSNSSNETVSRGSSESIKVDNDLNSLKKQVNKLSLNGSPMMNNRASSHMNKLRDTTLPNRRRPMNMNLNLNGLDNPSKPTSMRVQKDNNSFTPFAKYIDVKSGQLNFAGKASLHSRGIDFSNGSSFRISMDDLEILEELGHGNYGVVSKVLHKPTGIIMAMKEVRLELDDAKFRQILMELEVLHSCSSDCIVEFYGAFFVEGAVYMCIEYMKGGSLDKVYGDGVPEVPLAYITKRVILGLKQLKDEQNIIHRDVKPTNILVNEVGKVKLCDFGVSGNLVASLARTNIGCQSYMAPERIKHTSPDASTYSVQSDIWSLGLSILEISKGCYPYPPETYNNVFSQLSAIVDGEPPGLPPGKFGPEAQDFVRQCLHKNPSKRPTYRELLQHPWLNMYDDSQGQEMLKEMVDQAIEKSESGKQEEQKKSVPALHSGLQV